MATFPSTPAVGDEFTVGNNTFTYNGIGWVTIPTSSANLTYAPTPPAFASVFEGHIWVNSNTMEQFVYIIDDTPSSVWVSLGSISALNNSVPPNFRNIIMNGSALIDQRYGTTSGGTFVLGSLAFYADRWYTTASASVQNRLTGGRNYSNPGFPDGFTSCLGYRTTNAYIPVGGDACLVEQYIEGLKLRGLHWGSLNAKSLTISFWVYTNIAGDYSVVLRKVFFGIVWSYVHDITHAGLGWQYFSFTIAPNTSSPGSADWDYQGTTAQLLFGFNLSSGPNYSTATPDTWVNTNAVRTANSRQITSTLGHIFCFTGVQIELGSKATEYEHMPFERVLDDCQRHFQKSYNYRVAIGTNDGSNAIAFNPWDPFDTFPVQYNKPMRATPSIQITPSNVSGFGSLGRFSNGVGAVLANIYNIGDTRFTFGGNNNAIRNNVNAFHWWAESEPNII